MGWIYEIKKAEKSRDTATLRAFASFRALSVDIVAVGDVVVGTNGGGVSDIAVGDVVVGTIVAWCG